eukprot:TRINITY_DN13210_c0_g1_i1.p1 TRINITY_DN13210_c0_g1~~TRINITY_DN13210_c0_g1_i1.p1  ORF type:complete len:572 (+),score=126.96 TRINITY_DN13210_c0_g1_i1:64-1716(+)
MGQEGVTNRPVVRGLLLVVALFTLLAAVNPSHSGRGKDARNVLSAQQQQTAPSKNSGDRVAALAAAGGFVSVIAIAVLMLKPPVRSTGEHKPTQKLPSDAASPAVAPSTVYLRRDLNGRFGLVHLGTIIEAVQPGGAAHAAGIRPGMTVVAVGGEPVEHHDELTSLIASAGSGVTLSIVPAHGQAAPRALHAAAPSLQVDPEASARQRALRKFFEEESKARLAAVQTERAARQRKHTMLTASRSKAEARLAARLEEEAGERRHRAEAEMWLRISEKPDSALARAQGRWRVVGSSRHVEVQGLRVIAEAEGSERELREVPPGTIQLEGRRLVALRGGRLRWDDGSEWLQVDADGTTPVSPAVTPRSQTAERSPRHNRDGTQSPLAGGTPPTTPPVAAEDREPVAESPAVAAAAEEPSGNEWPTRLWASCLKDVAGEYHLLPCEEQNGLPVWGCGEKRLYADSAGMWVLAPSVKEMERGNGSAWTPHGGGLSPDKCQQAWWNGAQVTAEDPEGEAGEEEAAGGFGGWAASELHMGLRENKLARLLIDSSTAP